MGLLDDFSNDAQAGSQNSNYYKLGLNQNCFISLEFVTNTTERGDWKEAIDIVISREGNRDITRRLFKATKGWEKTPDGQSIVHTEGIYLQGQVSAITKYLMSVVKVFVSMSKYKIFVQKVAKLNDINDFKGLFNLIKKTLPNDYTNQPVDVFLEYPYKRRDGNPKKYLELPKSICRPFFGTKVERKGKDDKTNVRVVKFSNVKPTDVVLQEVDFAFYSTNICIAKGTTCEWTENIHNDAGQYEVGLTYSNEKGEEHVFTRNGRYVNGPNRKQDALEERTTTVEETNSSTVNDDVPF